MDIIFLKDMRVQTTVGIWEWERRLQQTVSIDLEMGADIRRAAETDDIDSTVDYRAVAKRVTSFVADSKFQLVESMAEGIAEIVTGEFSVPWVKVVVHKPGAVRGSQDVGICIERGQK